MTERPVQRAVIFATSTSATGLLLWLCGAPWYALALFICLAVCPLFLIAHHLPIGTRSLLFGVHQVMLHPLFLAVAWTKLYGLPLDPRLWIAFIVHDLGYWGLPNMDGDEGQRHPELGGRIMGFLFGEDWARFTRFHSRYYAKLEGREVSPLCAADKLVLAVTPKWLYLRLARWSGEDQEYLALAERHGFYRGGKVEEWHALLRAHWINEARRLAPASAERIADLA